MKTVFISYANEAMAYSLKRIGHQARKLNIFSDIRLYTPANIPQYVHESPLFPYKRGGGYWCWKPVIIEEALKRYEEGTVVVYVDAGCTQYNKSGTADDVMYNLASTSEVQKISIPKTSEMYINAFPEGSTNGYLDIYFRAADEYGATGVTKVRLQVVRLNDLD